MTSAPDLGDCPLHQPKIFGEVEILVRHDDVNEMMLECSLLLSRRFGRANIHQTVNLAGVSADGFKGEMVVQFQCKICLARSGWANQSDERS